MNKLIYNRALLTIVVTLFLMFLLMIVHLARNQDEEVTPRFWTANQNVANIIILRSARDQKLQQKLDLINL